MRRPAPRILALIGLAVALSLSGQPGAASARPLAARESVGSAPARPTSGVPAAPQIIDAPRVDPIPALRSQRLEAAHAAAPVATAQRQSTTTAPRYVGRDHFWFPALGINASVTWYACSRTDYPGPIVYRWGCAGTNNVYLFGHAANAFSALYRAYYAGTVKVGQILIYADHAGVIHRYRISVVRLEDGRIASDYHWAVGAQPVPSLTLQTCSKVVSVDIMVRAVEIL